MFKIEYIQFNRGSENQVYKFSKHTYIYGKNSSGKTALTKAINYVLGSTETNFEYQGLDNIDSYELHISNGDSKIWIKRDLNNDFFYKRSHESEYTKVSQAKYKETIESILVDNKDNKFKKIYQKIFEENPTYRSFIFLNFIEEKGLGDLENVFNKARELKNYFRVRDIMRFFFDFNNIEKLYEAKRSLKDRENKREVQLKAILKYENVIRMQRIFFNEIGLKYTGNKENDYDTLRIFKRNFMIKNLTSKKDLIELMKKSFSLSEQLKMYRFMRNQNELTVNQKDKIKKLLENFREITIKNDNYRRYSSYIEGKLEDLKRENIILNSIDYKKIINNLKSQKEYIDSELLKVKSNASSSTFENIIQKIAVLEQSFLDMDIKDAIDIESLEKEIKELKKEIKIISKNFSEEVLDNFNKDLTKMYRSFSNDISYVEDDFKNKNFKLYFNPFKLLLSIQFEVKKEEEYRIVQPGSMARQTQLQILTYLEMFKLLGEKFPNLPYLPVLIMDSVNQPMESEKFNTIYHRIIEFADEIGIQTIFLSKDKLFDIKEDYDISKGLNQFHDRKNA